MDAASHFQPDHIVAQHWWPLRDIQKKTASPRRVRLVGAKLSLVKSLENGPSRNHELCMTLPDQLGLSTPVSLLEVVVECSDLSMCFGM